MQLYENILDTHNNKHSCPVTGLPIRRSADWFYASDRHAYSTGLINDNLIVTKAAGHTDLAGVAKYCRIMEEIFAAKSVANHKFVILEDYADLTGAEIRARKKYIDFFSRQHLHLAAIIFINTNFQMNLSVRLGQALHIVKFKVELQDDYQAALRRAGELLGRDFGAGPMQSMTGPRKPAGALCPGFKRQITFSDFDYTVEVLSGDIVYTIANGVLRSDYIPRMFEVQREAARSLKPESKPYFSVHNVENLAVDHLKTRRKHLAAIKVLYKEYPFSTCIVYGASRMLRAGILMASGFVPFDIQLAQNFDDAMQIIKQLCQNLPMNPNANMPQENGAAYLAHRTTQDYVKELMHFIGGIKWDRKGQVSRNLPDESHPFLPVMDAIALIKDDLDNLIHSHKATEIKLKESEENYRRILEEINDAFFEVDLNGDLTFCNRSFSSLLGYERKKIIGLNYREYIDPANIPPHG